LVKKPEELALEYAGFWIRLGAGVIDLLIIAFVYYVTYRITSGILPPLLDRIIMITFAIVLSCVYDMVFWVWRGQTPGKMIAGIKIIRTDSSPLTFPHALFRYFGYMVSCVIAFIGFILIAFDSHKQGLHDRMADTYVVKLPVRQVTFSRSLAGG
jgi:uncharacterized RDD family membrane protein YckC